MVTSLVEYDEALSGFLWLGLPTGKIADHIISEFPGLHSKGEWKEIIPDIQEAYRNSVVEEGLNRFTMDPGYFVQADATVSYIIDETGLGAQDIIAYLSILERMSIAGKIDDKYWNPQASWWQTTVVDPVSALTEKAQTAAVGAASATLLIGALAVVGIGLVVFSGKAGRRVTPAT